MNAKKLLIITSILLSLILLSLAVYNFFIKAGGDGSPETSESSSPGNNAQNTSLPAGNNGSGSNGSSASQADLKIRPISQEKVMAPVIGSDGKTVKYYSKTIGNVFESAFDGSGLKKISSATLEGLAKILWSPDKEKVIGVFSKDSKTERYFYDYATNRSSLLNSNIGYVAWSPDSKKIAYQFTSAESEESNISIADPDGSNWKNIFKTRLADLIVEWPSRGKISIRSRVSGLAQGLLYAINPDSGDFEKVLSDLNGLNVKWSPKADKILYSFTTSRGKNPALWLSNEDGTQTKDLKLAGIADKCAWSNDDRTIFCALPQEISEFAVWPDDYYKGLVILSDNFYKINLETGEKTKIAGSSAQFSFDAQDLFLSPKEDLLFFVNRADGLLYSLKI